MTGAHLIRVLLVQDIPDIPPQAMEVVRMFFTTIVVIALGIPIIRAFTRRFERGPAPRNVPSPDVVARLQRIEQAVESVAIEVERIAEAQRFSAKLQAEQAQRGLPRSDR
jgi:hypothetical protein